MPHGSGKNGTFQMPATQSPMSIPKGKTAGQLLILCLINNVVHSFLTFTKSFLKSVLKSVLSKIPNFDLALKYIVKICTMNIFRYRFVH